MEQLLIMPLVVIAAFLTGVTCCDPTPEERDVAIEALRAAPAIINITGFYIESIINGRPRYNQGLQANPWPIHPGTCGNIPVHDNTLSRGRNSNQKAKQGELPWQVRLEIGGRFRRRGRQNDVKTCGGVLLSEYSILTAASCVNGAALWKIEITVGNIRKQSDGINQQTVGASKVITHPHYQTGSSQFDLAVIKTDATILLSGYVMPICLPDGCAPIDLVQQEATCISHGWRTSYDRPQASDRNGTLSRTFADIINVAQCNDGIQRQNRYNEQFTSTSNFLCARNSKPTTQTCQADTGGPLVCNSEGTAYHLEGTLAFHNNCNSPKVSLGVFTRSCHFLDWIKQAAGV